VPLYALAERGPGLVPWRILDYTMDYRILVYLAAVSVATGLLFGLVPAIRLSRVEMNASLKDGGRGTLGGRRSRRLSGILVTAEIALAVVLLAGAGVMIRSLWNLSAKDAGVNPVNVLTSLLQLPDGRYPGPDSQIGFYDRLKARVEAMPGMESFALASQLPTFGVRRLPYELAGAPPVDERSRPTTSALVVSPSYFRTLGTGILAGREFNEADRSSGVPAAIVNQKFANTRWAGEDPLGKRLRLFNGQTPDAWVTVVGVAPNIVQNDATRQTFDPLVYLPYSQNPRSSMWVIARSRVPPETLRAAFRYELRALDSDLSIWLGPSTLSERLGDAYWNKRLYGQLFLILAAIALVLACVGLYAVVAHSVSERTQEIGIRMAMGATARQILTAVFQAGFLQLGTGLAIGLAASLAVNRLLQAELVQVSPGDPLALVVASATLIVAAALGCLIPARRAIRVDPLVALRYE
jgi:putative ABC transport system permease protein